MLDPKATNVVSENDPFFRLKTSLVCLTRNYIILKFSARTHLLFLVKERAEVIPSPVGPAMVKVV